MSNAASTWAWKQKCPDAGTKLVLVKLADYADDEGICWPNLSGVADDTGLSEEDLRDALSRLIEHGFLFPKSGGFRLACMSEPSVTRIAPVVTRKRYVRLIPEDWASLRIVVFERDNFTCQYCGETSGPLECDHRVPLSRNGTSELENLVTACRRCNRSKKDKLLTEWRQ